MLARYLPWSAGSAMQDRPVGGNALLLADAAGRLSPPLAAVLFVGVVVALAVAAATGFVRRPLR